MIAENINFKQFKTYNYYKNQVSQNNEPRKRNYKALVGAAAGAFLTSAYWSKKPKKDTIPDELARMLSTAGLANALGVVGGSIGADKKAVKKKCKEAGFQMLNTAIPMLMVSGVLGACKNIKKLNNKPAKIIGSIMGMTSGAWLATKITNETKQDDEPIRKYTLRDSVANFDDIIATVSIGFKKVLDYVPVDKMLPFIYAYCGYRSGEKE